MKCQSLSSGKKKQILSICRLLNYLRELYIKALFLYRYNKQQEAFLLTDLFTLEFLMWPLPSLNLGVSTVAS